MMTVKTRGPSSRQIGKPAVHPATIDLKGRAYEYVSSSLYILSFRLLCSSGFGWYLLLYFLFLVTRKYQPIVLLGLFFFISKMHCSCWMKIIPHIVLPIISILLLKCTSVQLKILTKWKSFPISKLWPLLDLISTRSFFVCLLFGPC